LDLPLVSVVENGDGPSHGKMDNGLYPVNVLCVGNIVVINVKDKGRLQMSKMKIARWKLLETLLLDY